MSLRPSSRYGGANSSSGDRRESSSSMMDIDESLLPTQDELSDDDNAAEESEELVVEKEDPLLLAIDDLEGRVVSALDDVRMHPGVRTASGASGAASVHEELATLLAPVLEVAAHTGPSIARTYYQGVGAEGIELSVQNVYERVVSDLVLPVMLEVAQSDTSPAKRSASLEFFRHFWKESHKAGSWLDRTATGMQAGPYGSGGSGSSSAAPALTPAARAALKRRHGKRLAREGEILRYWVEASVACTLPGAFTDDESEGAVASRGIIAASASLRPSFHHIATRIKDADDRGANRLYGPVMKMLEGVLKKLFLSSPSESVLSASIKFLEIVILCCSRKPTDSSSRRRGGFSSGDFSLEDLPSGHPVITREALGSIAEYAFTTLRGLLLMGGQVKIDVNILSDMMLTSGGGGSPSEQVVSILKPAGLAYLEIESNLSSDKPLEYELDRANLEFDFLLSQKSYALVINAAAALAVNRPMYFKEASVCIARRAVQPPVFSEGGHLSRQAVLALAVQLKGSCLTLLRNALSVATNACDVLHAALKTFDMEVQADKAVAAARQATALKTAGRAARNRANMYYEWDASEGKRQRETDDALAKMRAVKAARGLGHGIQLPTNMTEAVELIVANLSNLPAKRPASTSKEKNRRVAVTLDFLVDAVMTNGATLSQEEGKWYDRDGGSAWIFDGERRQKYSLGEKMLETIESALADEEQDLSENEFNKRRKLFRDQCRTASSDAFGRIIENACYHRSKSLASFANRVAARLAFTLGSLKPTEVAGVSHDMAKSSVKAIPDDVAVSKNDLVQFLDRYPLVSASLALDSTAIQDQVDLTEVDPSLHEQLLCEALLQGGSDHDYDLYDRSLDIVVAATVNASRLANDKPSDNNRKRVAARSASNLQKEIAKVPRLTQSSLLLLCTMCDIDTITKKASEAARKTSQDSIAASAAAHAAKVAAEKRATSVLLTLRDTAFQRDCPDTRRCAVSCAVSLASGRMQSSTSVQDKALKLTMNVLYAKSDEIADFVVESATSELKFFSDLAVSSFDAIKKANSEAEKDDSQKGNPLMPQSDDEKHMIERMRKPAVLYMALCMRKPELIEKLFRLCSVEKADVLSKTVRSSMSKLSRASAAKHGAANVAIRVASMCTAQETPMLLSFLENLGCGNNSNEEDIIEACFKIQESKAGESGKKDPRYIIPVVAVMKRQDLVRHLPEFVAADDNIFLAALVRMGDRQQRQALLFRDEPDEENPSLHGMTLCEQLVFLHRLDFSAASLPQKRYLSSIKLCLDDDGIYNDRVVMSALDHMSGTFLAESVPLPLAFMRTVILTCSKHESLHSWICHVLLPRLVEGKIYEDARQWEGWMRCAHMLEKSGDVAANSAEAIAKLPPEQLMQYKTKWAGK